MASDIGKTNAQQASASHAPASQAPPAETAERPHGDPSALPTVVLGIVGAVLVLIIVIALETLYYGAQQGEDRRKFVNQPSAELQSLQAEQQEQLNGYRWVDQAKGTVAIPIDRAMQLAARDLNASRGGIP